MRDELLKFTLSVEGANLSFEIIKKFRKTLDRPVSSTGKYHLKNGRILTIMEHTNEMFYAASKLFEMFNIQKRSSDADLIGLGIILHDILKYGVMMNNKNTTYDHPHLIADRINKNKGYFNKVLSLYQINILEEIVRFHMGRFTSNLTGDFFELGLHKYTYFIHMLDFMSSRDLIKI